MNEVLRRTVVCDWRFDDLCGSHRQSEVTVLVSWKFKSPGERFDWSIDRVAVGTRVTWLIPGASFSKVPKTFRARKAIRKTTTCLFCKAGPFICCKENKNQDNCKVSCLETPSFWRYKENYVSRNAPEKFQDFRETGPRNHTRNGVNEIWGK